ncbi:MAG TPA: hypothetical protein PLU72_11555 [Candidatus Ozemobacteraceae bacterium]|nr:hypothetical protein [Candidatus Ozemobacteraceae bacterium]
MNRRGIALMVVLGLLAVMGPLVFFLSSFGSSQTRQAVHYHERLSTEAVAWSAIEAGIANLQGGGGAGTYNGTIQGLQMTYSLNPTGMGMASQTLYNVFGRSTSPGQQYAFLVNCEQYPVSPPTPGNLVIPHHFWGTLQPFDITYAPDCLSMENARGVDLLALEQTRAYELGTTQIAYRAEMTAKQAQLPAELAAIWPSVTDVLVAQKSCPNP